MRTNSLRFASLISIPFHSRSCYVSFYKGLGGITGAMLCGSRFFIANARIWLRRFGGNVFQQYPLVTSCMIGFDKMIENPEFTFSEKRERMKQLINILSKDETITRHVYFVPAVPTCCITHVYVKCESDEKLKKARDEVENETNIKVFNNLRKRRENVPGASYWEWNIGNANIVNTDDVVLKGFQALCAKMN